MPTTVASLAVEIGANVAGLKDGLSTANKGVDNFASSVEDRLGNLGKGMQSLGGSMTLVGAPFLALGVKAFAAFDEMDDAAGQLDAVLKSTGGAAGVTRQEVLRMGAELQDASTYTRAAIVSGQNLLLTFTNIHSDVFPRATQAMVDMSTAMGGDLKGSAIQLGKALNDPKAGVTALTRVGVTFTDQQKKMIATMQDAGDVAGAQAVILAEVEKEFGGSAAAQVDTMSQLAAAANDVFIDLGVTLEPIVDEVGGALIGVLKGISQGLTAMTDNGDNTVGIVIAIGAAMAIAGPLIAGVGTVLTVVAPAVGVLSAAFALAVSPIGLVAAGLALLAIGANQVIDFTALGNTIRTGLVDPLNDLKDLTGFDAVGLADAVKQKIQAAFGGGDVFSAGVDRSGFQSGTTAMTDEQIAAMAGIPAGGSLFTPLGQKIANDLSTSISTAVQSLTLNTGIDLTGLTTGITSSFSGLDFSNITTIMQTHFNDILTAIVSVVGIVFGGPISLAIGAARLVGLAIDNNFLGLGDFLRTSGIGDSVTTALTDLKTDIESIVNQVFGGGGGDSAIGDGKHQFMTNIMPQGQETSGPMQLFISDLRTGFDALKGILGDSWDKLSPGIDSIKNGIVGFIDALKGTDTEGLLRVVTGIGGAIGAILAPMVEIGSELAGDILTNIGTALPQIGSFISNLVSAISGIGKGDFTQTATDLGQAALDIGQAALDLFGIQITLPDFQSAIDGWTTAFDSIKAVVDTIGGQISTKLQEFVNTVKSIINTAIGLFIQAQIALADVIIGVGSMLGQDVSATVSFKTDLQNRLAGLQATGSIPGAATGANVDGTGVALLHQGERVLNPEETAAYENGGRSSGPVTNNFYNMTSVDDVLFELKRRGIQIEGAP